LDEFDDLVKLIESAMLDQEAARVVVMDTDSEMELMHASATLSVEGSNEAVRRAAVVVQLRNSAEYQTYQRANREARAALHTAERRLAVSKLRLTLVKSALMLMIPVPTIER
jgi:hypothetical protein